jgi:aspartate aminotransferase-like enzyme
MNELRFKIADLAEEFDAIHELNYRTFVEEIPQHPANPQRRLVDAFHPENTYAICLDGQQVVGMIAGRGQRPFSLDRKIPELDTLLPPHHAPLEVRLLSVDVAYRKSRVFTGLIAELARHFSTQGYDLALISGTVRQLKLYRHMGFVPFGNLVGTAEALYQPMYLNLESFLHLTSKLERLTTQVPSNFTAGPVEISPAVADAFQRPAISHRSDSFMELHRQTRRRLCDMTSCEAAYLLMGSGTLANEAVAAQLSLLKEPGLILSNGEFGERLIDHARRWNLDFIEQRLAWGEQIQIQHIERLLTSGTPPRWLWMVVSETSTGMLNPYLEIAALCQQQNIGLYLDAVSAIGTMPLDLHHARLATAVSGKALGALPGLAIVLVNGDIAEAGKLPRYLDLASYAAADSVPFTQSSNLLAALAEALNIDWPQRYARIANEGQLMRARLRDLDFELVAHESAATPAVATMAFPAHTSSSTLGSRMAQRGIQLNWESNYLRQRNWLQICLMGEFREAALQVLPSILANEIRKA